MAAEIPSVRPDVLIMVCLITMMVCLSMTVFVFACLSVYVISRQLIKFNYNLNIATSLCYLSRFVGINLWNSRSREQGRTRKALHKYVYI